MKKILNFFHYFQCSDLILEHAKEESRKRTFFFLLQKCNEQSRMNMKKNMKNDFFSRAYIYMQPFKKKKFHSSYFGSKSYNTLLLMRTTFYTHNYIHIISNSVNKKLLWLQIEFQKKLLFFFSLIIILYFNCDF